jgi:hypothetical protein
MRVEEAPENGRDVPGGDAGAVQVMRSDARELEDQSRGAEGTPDAAVRLLDADLAAALRTGKCHGLGGSTASPQLVQNFVRGGSGV